MFNFFTSKLYDHDFYKIGINWCMVLILLQWRVNWTFFQLTFRKKIRLNTPRTMNGYTYN